MADWSAGQVGLHFIPPGEPWRNGYVESFNSRIRDECLNINSFWSLAHAQVVISDWKHDYNHHRRHSFAGLPTTSPLRCHLYSSMNDSRSPWTSSRGPFISLAAAALENGREVTVSKLATCADAREIQQLLLERLVPAAVEATPRQAASGLIAPTKSNSGYKPLARCLESERAAGADGGDISQDKIWKVSGERMTPLHPRRTGGIAIRCL